MKPLTFNLLGIIFVLATTFQTHAQTWLTNGLVAYYPFNGNVNDASGNGNNLTNYGATLCADRFGNPNQAFYFDGLTNYMSSSVVDSVIPSGSADRTFSLWIKADGVVTNGATYEAIDYADPQNSYNSSFGLLLQSGFLLVHFDGPFNDISSGIKSDALWHQVVCIYSSGNVQMFIDGICYLNAPRPTSTSVGKLLIGAAVETTSYFFLGAIDDVRIYNWALSSNDVAALYTLETPLLKIVSFPTNVTVMVGSNATLAVSASSPTPISYQWYFTNSNPARLAVAHAQTVNGFVYNAVVTSGGYGYGNVPKVSFVGGGGSGAGGYGTVSNGVMTGIIVTNAGNGGYANLPDVVIDLPNGLVYGQTNNSLYLTNVNSANVGGYYVVVSNDIGSITSDMALLSLLYPPAIVTDPLGFIQPLGSSNTLGAVASGTWPLHYQWTLNGTNLPGAISATYTVSNLDLINLGDYAVLVSNPYGSVTSSIASVFMTPSLTAPFIGTIGLWGQPTVLSVGATGSGILNYQWYFNGLPIPGANGSNYLLGSIQLTNAGLYSVVVSSTYGSVSNTAFQVVVNPANVGIQMFPGVIISGTPGYTYNIQSTTNLANPNSWVDETNLILSSTFQIWSDYSDSNRIQKYYRVQAGQ